MTPLEITFFSVTLFLALAALLTWKRRRDILHARLNKGLRGYVSNAFEPRTVETEARIVQTAPAAEELITA